VGYQCVLIEDERKWTMGHFLTTHNGIFACKKKGGGNVTIVDRTRHPGLAGRTGRGGVGEGVVCGVGVLCVWGRGRNPQVHKRRGEEGDPD
jgi:hypothetical protein